MQLLLLSAICLKFVLLLRDLHVLTESIPVCKDALLNFFYLGTISVKLARQIPSMGFLDEVWGVALFSILIAASQTTVYISASIVKVRLYFGAIALLSVALTIVNSVIILFQHCFCPKMPKLTSRSKACRDLLDLE